MNAKRSLWCNSWSNVQGTSETNLVRILVLPNISKVLIQKFSQESLCEYLQQTASPLSSSNLLLELSILNCFHYFSRNFEIKPVIFLHNISSWIPPENVSKIFQGNLFRYKQFIRDLYSLFLWQSSKKSSCDFTGVAYMFPQLFFSSRDFLRCLPDYLWNSSSKTLLKLLPGFLTDLFWYSSLSSAWNFTRNFFKASCRSFFWNSSRKFLSNCTRISLRNSF